MGSFSLPADLPQKRKDKVKEWTLSKMAQQFNNWKKKLWKKYAKKPPNFTGHLVKIKDDWPEFVAYKKSAVAVARSTQNKLNAKKKKYFHRWTQVATRLPCLSGKPMKTSCVKKGSLHRQMTGPTGPSYGCSRMG